MQYLKEIAFIKNEKGKTDILTKNKKQKKKGTQNKEKRRYESSELLVTFNEWKLSWYKCRNKLISQFLKYYA